ncbi:uncharacterized protein Bfra_002593 [Botrytis fragariae]|uniref:Uncharacterized protein n=1 Tax=Botrytis fragariae TaxID=1964551 RepID=A0A8H6AYK8_9HELO|nr:uncharacterized protein Bfra_002593 [Botrytis fragariae]KAF5876191.1 hypothetical protein Bfra_002593 [Botrytis fragariae]
MSRNNPSIDPQLSLELSLELSTVEGRTTEVEDANDNQVSNTNEDCRQIEAGARNFNNTGGAFGNALGIDLMDISELMRNNDSILHTDPVRNSDSIRDNDFTMSSSDRNNVSEDEEISQSEYSDDEDMDLEESLKVAEDVAPLLLRSPSSPPSYSPPPTPVLKFLPMFTLGPGISSASAMPFFDDPTRYATRINARKVRMHDTRLTAAEEKLRQLPGIWWRRISKIPSSLRKCWTPYDIFDEYLENTLVAVNDYGAEETEVDTEVDVSK